MELGIVGLPNVGKSTLFNALTRAKAPVASYPFTTIEPNIGVVEVPDSRLHRLGDMFKPKKLTPPVIRFLDIAGLVKGASKGEGLGNQFLGRIRGVEAIVHVVRCFEDQNVTHIDPRIDPLRDIEIVNIELILADLETIERRVVKTEKMLKTGERRYREEFELLKKIRGVLEKGLPIRTLTLSPEEEEHLRDYQLLTSKPVVYLANIGEEDIASTGGEKARQVKAYAEKEGTEAIVICAQIEAEIAELPKEEAETFLREMGLMESGLNKLIKTCYKLLNLITFFTVVGDEIRAWTIEKGTKAPQAAGKVHSDMERGFICAEIISFSELSTLGSLAAAREKGLIRVEGRDYPMRDGDIAYFRFQV